MRVIRTYEITASVLADGHHHIICVDVHAVDRDKAIKAFKKACKKLRYEVLLMMSVIDEVLG